MTLTFGGCGTSEEWHVNYVAGHNVSGCPRLLLMRKNWSRSPSDMFVLFVDTVTTRDSVIVAYNQH